MLSSNSVEEGKTSTYDSREQFELLTKKIDELNALKVRISIATQGVLPSILKQAELKSMVTNLKSMSVADGADHTYSRYNGGVAVTKVANIKEKERDEMIASMEAEIDSLQDEIDTYNATTTI